MPLISAKDAEQLKRAFDSGLTGAVKLVMFTQTIECEFCAETRQIVEEIAALSDKIELEVYDFVTDKAMAELYGIDKIPAIAILGRKDGRDRDYGIRFYGIPSGYEFTSLIEDILSVSKGDTELKPQTKEALAKVAQPVHIQVFVTPTCPYCTQAVVMAHQFAMENEWIRADMVEAIEFPHLAGKYHVHGVPRIIFNDTVHQEGAVPEALMVAKLLEAIGMQAAPVPAQTQPTRSRRRQGKQARK
jgi:glutaredoxin-like protein